MKYYHSLLSIMLVFCFPLLILAQAPVQNLQGNIQKPPTFDTYDDTILYDDGAVAWWYGGLSDFSLVTKFTPVADFELQAVQMAFYTGAPSYWQPLYVCDDMGGWPGNLLWEELYYYPQALVWETVHLDTTGALFFPEGEDFWIQLYSGGPPYEMMDASQILPARSYFRTGIGAWVESPGDNFIRAIGKYVDDPVIVTIEDVYWENEADGSLIDFAPLNLDDDFLYNARALVANHSNITVDVDLILTVRKFSNGQWAYYYSESQPEQLSPLAVSTALFGPFGFPEGRYQCQIEVAAGGILDDATGFADLQVYANPPEAVELSFGNGDGGPAYTTVPGDGWSMLFIPNYENDYVVETVKFKVIDNLGNATARLQVWLADPQTQAPSSLRWETVEHLNAGWNEFQVNVDLLGGAAFHVAYLFENGFSTPSLYMDDFPNSIHSWEKLFGNWVYDPDAADWMIRATITDNSPSPVYIDLLPIGSTYLPPGGGTVNYNVALGNNGTVQEIMDCWLDVTLPDGSTYGPVIGPVEDFILYGGWSSSRERSLDVPGAAPGGTYTLNGYLGEWDAVSPVIVAEDHFNFIKSGEEVVPGVFELTDMGEPLLEVVPEIPAAPSELCLGVSPNPFNPSTMMSYNLPVAGHVNLTVYDISGRKVAELIEGWQQAGNHAVTFEGTGLAGGVYVYRLLTGEHSLTGKMLLIK